MRAQQVPHSAKPTEKGGNGESIDGGRAIGCMTMPDLRAVRQMKVGVTEVKVAPVRMAASEERDDTEGETQYEADEIENFPRHFISPNSALFAVYQGLCPLRHAPPALAAAL